MKKIVTVSLIFLISFQLKAQETFYKNKFALNLGSSTYGMATNYLLNRTTLIKDCFASIIPQISYTYQTDKHFGVGGAFSYQYFKFNFLPLTSTSNAITADINRMNLSVHAIASTDLSAKQNIYFGLRMGLTYWNGNISMAELRDYLSNLTSSTFVNLIIAPIINKLPISDYPISKFFVSYQLFIGSEMYLTKQLGLNLQLAMGTPYWAMAGATYRI